MTKKKVLSGRINIFICPKQQKNAKKLAKRTNINLSEYIRRLIDVDILREGRKKKGLKRLLERERMIHFNLIAPEINRFEQLKLSAIGSPFKSGN